MKTRKHRYKKDRFYIVDMRLWGYKKEKYFAFKTIETGDDWIIAKTNNEVVKIDFKKSPADIHPINK